MRCAGGTSILSRREVKIETRVDPYRDEDGPKTKAGLRTIPLGQGVLGALRGWRERSKYGKPDDLVFPNSLGGYQIHTDMMKRNYRPLFAKLEQRWREVRRNEPVERFSWHA